VRHAAAGTYAECEMCRVWEADWFYPKYLDLVFLGKIHTSVVLTREFLSRGFLFILLFCFVIATQSLLKLLQYSFRSIIQINSTI
jgi:hypothetical protein